MITPKNITPQNSTLIFSTPKNITPQKVQPCTPYTTESILFMKLFLCYYCIVIDTPVYGGIEKYGVEKYGVEKYGVENA